MYGYEDVSIILKSKEIYKYRVTQQDLTDLLAGKHPDAFADLWLRHRHIDIAEIRIRRTTR